MSAAARCRTSIFRAHSTAEVAPDGAGAGAAAAAAAIPRTTAEKCPQTLIALDDSTHVRRPPGDRIELKRYFNWRHVLAPGIMPLIASQTTMSSALALFLAAALGAAPAPETRGVWIVRTALTSPESVDAIVDRAHEAGLNSLFVQVRGRGDAFYTSRLVSRSDLLAAQPATFDPLARAIARADRY